MHARRSLVALALAAALAPQVLAGDANLELDLAQARGARVSDVAYELDLSIEKGSSTYDGVLLARFQLSDARQDLHLDFQGETIRSVEANGAKVKGWRFEGGKLWLPGRALRAGANAVEVRYTNDFDNDGAGLHKIVDPQDGNEYVYTDFEPYDANRLFPCFDQPDLKATYTLTATVPADWEAVSNGRTLSMVAKDGRRVHRFRTLPRFSTYIFAFCAGPFAVWTDPEARVPARIFCTQSMAKHMDPAEIFSLTRKGFRFFQRYFEIAYPYEKYDQIFLPQFNAGAMENVACVTFNERHIFRHDPTERERMNRANTILHEMAHMWFGDIVTMQWWNDLWLNESFATYMANLALVKATRFRDAWESFASGTKGWAYWQDQLPTTHPIETEVPDTDTTFTNFDGITYGKGASVLKQLAFYVGDEPFRKGVSAYLKKFRNSNATRKDFMDSIAAAAELDLDDWTRRWLQTSGVNTLRPRIELSNGKIWRFYVDQGEGNGDGVLRPHRLSIALYRQGRNGAVERYHSAVVRVDGKTTRVKALEGQEAPAFVDANDGDHAYAKVFLDARSLAFATAHLERLPSSFLRSKVWTTLGFMVRDAVTPPTVYLDLLLTKAEHESNDKLVSSVAWNLGTYLTKYLPPTLGESYAARINELAWRMVGEAAAGSDLQKVWFSVLRSTSRSPQALAKLEGLLDGQASIPGLEIDQDKRWKILVRLCAWDRPGARDRLAAEARRDPSERGKVSALEAKASLPDAAEKAALWQRFLTDEETPVAHLRAAMRHFFWTHQRDLTEGYVEKYFAALPQLLGQRDQSYVRAFAGGLYPDEFASPAIQRRGQAALERHADDPYFLRRSLMESLDEVERAVRVRATVR